MADGFLVRGVFIFSQSTAVSVGLKALILSMQFEKAHYATTTIATVTATKIENEVKNGKRKGQWLTLPPFTSTVDGAALGKELASRKVKVSSGGATSSTMTALKWVLRCCPELPMSLVQKLFRLRQVRRESFCTTKSNLVGGTQEYQLKRLAAKDSLNLGDQIFLPITVQKSPSVKDECRCSEQEIKFLHSLQLYKDEAIVAVNKPPGMPVQGGIRIHRSLDELAAAYMRYDLTEPPRLVHRLDRDSSGILVMGRTQLSATILHSIFREKTFGASNNDLNSKKRMLQRRYWALVLGCPRRPEGLISKPLLKVVMDNGKSERITVVDNVQAVSSSHAITEYRVIESFKGYTWLELSPLTGRKHQLRVHCAEVLGTPIVGDYKYGWQAHRKWKNAPFSNFESQNEKLPKGSKLLPFGLDLEGGSVFEKKPYLHLHCREMVLPNVSKALQDAQLSDSALIEVEGLKVVAPLPSHMRRSYDFLKSQISQVSAISLQGDNLLDLN